MTGSKIAGGLTGIICIIVCGVLLLTGCSSNKASINDVKGLAGIIPAGSSNIVHFDIEKIRQDGELKDMYESMSASNEFSIELDISLDDVYYYCMSETNFELVTMLSGNLDFKDIRDQLGNIDYRDEVYMDAEIWLSGSGAVAIVDDILIIGPEDGVKGSIEIMTADGASIYDDDQDLKDVIDKLPSGLITAILNTTYYTDSTSMGYSIHKVDSGTMEMNALVKFKNSDAAAEAISVISDELDNEDVFSEFNISQENEYVEFSVELSSEFAENMFS